MLHLSVSQSVSQSGTTAERRTDSPRLLSTGHSISSSSVSDSPPKNARALVRQSEGVNRVMEQVGVQPYITLDGIHGVERILQESADAAKLYQVTLYLYQRPGFRCVFTSRTLTVAGVMATPTTAERC